MTQKDLDVLYKLETGNDVPDPDLVDDIEKDIPLFIAYIKWLEEKTLTLFNV